MKAIRIAVLSVAVLFVASLSFAASDNNGFPSGPHYNLNIIGKKAGFTCPAQEYSGDIPIYGNVVFVPENGQGINLFMQSGKGSRAAAITELQAIDPCTFDNGKAVIQLPKNDNGYRVYARALAKPTSDPSMTITPSLVMAQDEIGNDLVYLGLVTSSGFSTPYQTITRTKGKQTALDVTGLFEWSGTVCYFSAPPVEAVSGNMCCKDENADGVYDVCNEPSEGLCADGFSLVPTYCVEYSNAWVFNIADFVEYLWSLDNTGVKLLQVRFYPN